MALTIPPDLAGLHSSIDIQFGSWLDELPEQILIMKHIPPSATVLEFGSFIGRSSCIIASVLDDDKRLVTLESNPSFSRRCKANRDANGFQFSVVNAAMSDVDLVQVGRRTRVWDPANPPKEIHRRVPRVTWPSLKEDYSHLTFDHLVVDCEGAFLPIVRAWPSILDGIQKIILENDFLTDTEATEMKDRFVAAGFSLIDTLPSVARNVPPSRKPDLHQVWSRT